MNKRVFITGTSGFAGESLFKYLKKKNIKITGTAFKNIKNKKDIKIDLTKKIKIKKNFDWIIHTAAHHKVEDFKNGANIKVRRNILMVKNLIDFLKNNRIRNFIFFSTIDINYLPHLKKKNMYIKSKNFCEKLLLNALKKNFLKKLIVLRIPAIVGKNCGENFIKNTLYNLKKNLPINIWNKNKKFNNLIHINDLNKLIFYFVSAQNSKDKVIVDCLSSKPMKLKNLVESLKKKLNSKSNIKYLNKKKKFKKIKFNPKINYEFFSVKKTINLLF
jgi:nucleoside-diphosphate-sugar epimerase